MVREKKKQQERAEIIENVQSELGGEVMLENREGDCDSLREQRAW